MWDCAPSALVVWPEATYSCYFLAWGDQVWESTGSMVGILVTSEGPMPKCDFQDCCCQCLSLWKAAADPCLRHRPSNTHRQIWLSLLFPGSLCTQGFVDVLQDFLFPLVLWMFCNQIPLSYKVRFPGDSQFLCWLPRLGSPMWGARTFITVWGLLWYTCSPVCGSPILWVWNLILSLLHPSYHLIGASPLSLDVGYLSLVGASILLSMDVQQLFVILVFSQEKMSSHSSTSPYLDWTYTWQYLKTRLCGFRFSTFRLWGSFMQIFKTLSLDLF